MKKLFLLIALGFSLQLSAQNLPFQWVKNISMSYRMVADQHDNVYISGYDSTFSYSFAKLDSSGNILWSHQLSEYITDLNVDSDGNLIVSNYFYNNLVLDGNTLLTGSSTTLMKFLANGQLDWYTEPINIDTGMVQIHRTVLDDDNNIIICGHAANVYFDTTFLQSDSLCSYIAKYSPSGQFTWVRGLNWGLSQGFFYSNQLDAGPSGDIVLYFKDSLIKYSAAGDFLWAKQLPYYMSEWHDSLQLAIDPFDNIYVAGYFDSTIVLGTDSFTSHGKSDIIVEKMDANGNHLWGYQYGGPEYNYPAMLCANQYGAVLAGDFTGDSILLPWQTNDINTVLIGLNQAGNKLFENTIISTSGCDEGTMLTMNDAIYACVLAGDSVFFNGAYHPGGCLLAKMRNPLAGIEQIGSGIAVYPNPASDYVEIHLSGIGQNTLAEIVNTEGRILKTVKLENASEIIDIRFLNSGIYFLRITDPEFSSVHRILKI